MDRGSSDVNPRLDEELKHRTEGLVRSGHTTHAEEWKDPEPSGEDQPDADLVPEGTQVGGTPAGMSADDVEGRAELATWIGKAPYPVVRTQLVDLARSHEAPDRVIDLLDRLPDGTPYESLAAVWIALGGHVETDRF